MKTKKVLAALTLASLLVVPVMALAAEPQQPIESGLTKDTLRGNILSFVWWLFAILALVCFVIAGILFLTAGGSAEKIAQAKTAVIYGVVGIAVAIIGYSIVAIVKALVM